MKTFISITVLIISSIFRCFSQDNSTLPDYKIEIINYNFGRINHLTMVTPQTISYKINQTSGKPKTFERKLNEEEHTKIVKFLESFPIAHLESMYMNEKVEDGTQITFIIRIKDTEKNIYVSNAFQKDLAALVKLIVPLLPENYICYDKKYVPWNPD